MWVPSGPLPPPGRRDSVPGPGLAGRAVRGGARCPAGSSPPRARTGRALPPPTAGWGWDPDCGRGEGAGLGVCGKPRRLSGPR